jgi:hypothetical protein
MCNRVIAVIAAIGKAKRDADWVSDHQITAITGSSDSVHLCSRSRASNT